MTSMLFGDELPEASRVNALSDTWVVPPMSVLDTRQGYWKERKARWDALGLGEDSIARSIVAGRNKHGESSANAMFLQRDDSGQLSNVSVFDPVLAELVYRWWCPTGGSVLDPFAGGAVRGVVASVLGHPYVGIDLSQRQVDANREVAQRLKLDPMPEWICADSRDVLATVIGREFDLVFSCPPYYDLEVYTRDAADLSNAGTYEDFRSAFASIIRDCLSMLKQDRFLVFVIGEARGRSGAYYGLVPDTVRAMQESGASFYNEAILVNSLGSWPMRVGQFMRASRKIGKVHQNVIVGLKGAARTRDWDLNEAMPPSHNVTIWPEE